MRTRYNVRTGVTKIKSKARQFSNKLTFGIAAGVASIGLAIIPMAAAANTVVTPSNPQGWNNLDTGTAGTVQYVPSSGGLGSGALEFTTPNGSDYTRFRNDTINMKVSDITSLSYMTNQVSAPGQESTADVNLRMYICTTGTDCDGGFNDVLVYEPYYNNAQQVIQPGQWQTWSISQSTGYWWSNSKLTYNGHTTTGAGSYATNFNLSDVVTSYPDAQIYSVGLGTGTSNSPWTVQADGVQINSTTYDFELNPSTVKVTIDKYIDGVKATAVTANNSTFPMQSSWTTTNIGSGTGTYGLGPVGYNSNNAYEAVTSDMSQGADYSTSEVAGGSVVGTSCTVNGAPYALVGYSTGDTLAAAQNAGPSATLPSFTNIQNDKYVIVWNKTCPPAPTVATNKDQCKNDGWMSLVDNNGKHFKNQGDCVSFVATKGKNQANGH